MTYSRNRRLRSEVVKLVELKTRRSSSRTTAAAQTSGVTLIPGPLCLRRDAFIRERPALIKASLRSDRGAEKFVTVTLSDHAPVSMPVVKDFQLLSIRR